MIQIYRNSHTPSVIAASLPSNA